MSALNRSAAVSEGNVNVRDERFIVTTSSSPWECFGRDDRQLVALSGKRPRRIVAGRLARVVFDGDVTIRLDAP